MILGSMHEAALTLGKDGVSALLHAAAGDPGALARMGLNAARAGLQLSYDTITRPRDMGRWIGSTARLAAELAAQSLRAG
jgi:hypothetical protein